jgi:hypothetical protein
MADILFMRENVNEKAVYIAKKIAIQKKKLPYPHLILNNILGLLRVWR